MPVGKPSKLNMALRAAKKLGPTMPGATWEQIRDCLDQATGGDLDSWKLDKATDAAIAARDKGLS